MKRSRKPPTPLSDSQRAYEDILRKLALPLIAFRGLVDLRAARTVSNEEMGRRIQRWEK